MTATLKEKLLKKMSEGLEAARHEIHAKLGEADVLRSPGSVIWALDLGARGKSLLIEIDRLEDEVLEFLGLRSGGPTGEERADQRQLDLEDAAAAERGRERTVSASIPGPAVAVPGGVERELEAMADAEAELGLELDRILGGSRALVGATVEPDVEDPLRLYAEVSSAAPDEAGLWCVCREAPRVLAALRELPDGAGAEAVRAALCGLAQQMDREAGATEPVDEEIGVRPADDLEPGCEQDADCPPAGCGAEGCDGPAEAGPEDGPGDAPVNSGTRPHPHGAQYHDEGEGRVVGVYPGLDGSSWGSMWRSESGGLHRVKSARVPMRPSPEEAQADLDAYAVDRRWARWRGRRR